MPKLEDAIKEVQKYTDEAERRRLVKIYLDLQKNRKKLLEALHELDLVSQEIKSDIEFESPPDKKRVDIWNKKLYQFCLFTSIPLDLIKDNKLESVEINRDPALDFPFNLGPRDWRKR